MIGRYRHFKGGEYEVLYIAKHSETLEDMVVYRALYGECGVWCVRRPCGTRPSSAAGTRIDASHISASEKNARKFETSLNFILVTGAKRKGITL